MSNIVDTSTETVTAEFDAAELEIGTENTETETATPPEPDPLAEAQKAAEIAMAKGMLSTSLRLAIGTFSGVSVDNQVTDEAAESYAIVLIKYFPGGFFALLDRYKEELAAVTATVMLIKAVADAKDKKDDEEEQSGPVKSTATPEPYGQASNGSDVSRSAERVESVEGSETFTVPRATVFNG